MKKEGELYRVLSFGGREFPIYYGYYDEIERHSRFGEPIPIYPDFIREPAYTEEGAPFATAMQATCPCYKGKHAEDGCFTCAYYKEGEEFLGICTEPTRVREGGDRS